jgi:hypothetical protein
MLMFDTITLDADAKVSFTRDGYLKAQPRVARVGIQIYGGGEVGRPDIESVRVYRPVDQVFADSAVHSYTHLPVTLDHPREAVTPDNWRKYAVGETGDEVLRDGGTARVPLMLRDAAAIAAVQNGTNQLSLGYSCDLDWTSGTTDDGERYDAVQKSIRANHLAVVRKARGGDRLRIGDAGTEDRRRKTTVQRDPRGRLMSTWEQEEIEEDHMTLEDQLARQNGYALDAESARLAAIFRNRERELKGLSVDGPTFVADGVDTRSPEYAAAITARHLKDEAYRAFVDETANAWRTPAQNAAPSPPVGSLTRDAAVRLRDEAWQAMVREQTEAWRR